MNAYIYLLRRDKKGLMLVATMPFDREIPATRIVSPNNFPPEILSIIEENKMMWEPWIESSDSYKNLKSSLLRKGYSKLPITAMPKFVVNQPINFEKTPESPKTMLKKFCGSTFVSDKKFR